MKRGVDGVCRNHAANEIVDQFAERLSGLFQTARDGQHVLEVAMSDGVD
jgi:hypothetical protein